MGVMVYYYIIHILYVQNHLYRIMLYYNILCVIISYRITTILSYIPSYSIYFQYIRYTPGYNLV
jgi:hypothetical protein